MVKQVVKTEPHPDLVEKYLEKKTFSPKVELISKDKDYTVSEVSGILDLPSTQVEKIIDKGFIKLHETKISGESLIEYIKESGD